jgi:hypothetical protein
MSTWDAKSRDLGEVLLYCKRRHDKGERKVNSTKKSKLGWQRIVIWKLFKDIRGPASK